MINQYAEEKRWVFSFDLKEESDISFSSAAHNLGVIFDSELALKEQVNKLCQLAYLEIRRIGSIRQYLSVEAIRTLVFSLVLSRLDYCNALLAGSPKVLLDKILSDQLLSSFHLQSSKICLHHFFTFSSPLVADHQPNSIQNSTLSLVQLLHTSLRCFISILLLLFVVQLQILGFFVSQGCAGGLSGRDPFSVTDLSSGTLLLSLSGMPRHSPLSSQN